MKKICFILLLLALAFGSKAQTASVFPLVAGDTVATSSSLDTVSKVINVTAGYSALGIQVVATKVGGTTASKAYLYSSIDGTNYVLTDSATAFANTAGAQSAFFTKTAGLPYVKYKVMVRPPTSGGSSETTAIRVYYVLRKFD